MNTPAVFPEYFWFHNGTIWSPFPPEIQQRLNKARAAKEIRVTVPRDGIQTDLVEFSPKMVYIRSSTGKRTPVAVTTAPHICPDPLPPITPPVVTVKDLAIQVLRITEDNDRFSQQNQGLKQKVSSMDAELNDTRTELNRAREELSNVQAEKAQLKELLRQEQQKNKTLQAENDKAVDENARLNRQYQILDGQVSAEKKTLVERLQYLDTENGELRKSLFDLQAAHDALKRSLLPLAFAGDESIFSQIASMDDHSVLQQQMRKEYETLLFNEIPRETWEQCSATKSQLQGITTAGVILNQLQSTVKSSTSLSATAATFETSVKQLQELGAMDPRVLKTLDEMRKMFNSAKSSPDVDSELQKLLAKVQAYVDAKAIKQLNNSYRNILPFLAHISVRHVAGPARSGAAQHSENQKILYGLSQNTAQMSHAVKQAQRQLEENQRRIKRWIREEQVECEHVAGETDEELQGLKRQYDDLVQHLRKVNEAAVEWMKAKLQNKSREDVFQNLLVEHPAQKNDISLKLISAAERLQKEDTILNCTLDLDERSWDKLEEHCVNQQALIDKHQRSLFADFLSSLQEELRMTRDKEAKLARQRAALEQEIFHASAQQKPVIQAKQDDVGKEMFLSDKDRKQLEELIELLQPANPSHPLYGTFAVANDIDDLAQQGVSADQLLANIPKLTADIVANVLEPLKVDSLTASVALGVATLCLAPRLVNLATTCSAVGVDTQEIRKILLEFACKLPTKANV